MIYELRFYEILPGRAPAFTGRQDVAVKLLDKHGAKVVGAWTQDVGTSNEIVYMIAFKDMAHRDQVWTAFLGEPDWKKSVAESEKDGPIVAKLVNSILRPTAYSPLQ